MEIFASDISIYLTQMYKMYYSKRKKDVKNAEKVTAVFTRELEKQPTRWKAVEATAKRVDYTIDGVVKLLKREGLWEKN